LVVFSENLNQLAATLNQVTATNGPEISVAIRNVESSAAMLKSLLTDLQAGKGLAGALLKDEQVATHVSTLASNLAITSSNLNRLGLWGILWKQKAPRTNVVSRQVYPGRNPLN
jgi:hypothetical protein